MLSEVFYRPHTLTRLHAINANGGATGHQSYRETLASSSRMTALPLDLTSDMEAIAEHQRITYAAMLVLGINGMKRLGEALLRPRRAMTYTERMNSGMQR